MSSDGVVSELVLVIGFMATKKTHSAKFLNIYLISLNLSISKICWLIYILLIMYKLDDI